MKKAELVRKIRQEFPELKWKKAVHNVEGWDHYVLILDNKYVFRFPRKADYRSQLFSEISLLKYLKGKINFQIPDYKFIAKDKSFAGYEMIQGVQLKKNIFDHLPQATKDTVAKQLAQFFTAVHNVPPKIAKKFVMGHDDPKKVYLDTVVKSKKFVFPRIAKPYRQSLLDFFQKIKNIKFPKKTLIHYDIYYTHILFDTNKKRLTGVIDFDDKNFEDPAVDFLELWYYGQDFVENVYKYYRGPKDQNFLARSHTYYKRMPIWNMISTFEEHRGNFRQQYKEFRRIWNQ